MPGSHLVTLARRARRLPPRTLLTSLRVASVLVIVEVLVRLVPLPRLSRLLGAPIDLSPSSTATETYPFDELTLAARRQLLCTWMIADAWPFSTGPCLRRALVGGHLIRDLRPAIRLGVAGAGDSLRAHAWLEIDGRPLETVEDYQLFETPRETAG